MAYASFSKLTVSDAGLRMRETPAVPLKEHPLYKQASVQYVDGGDVCGACKSTDTLCTYFYNWEDLVGKDIEVELECRACGKFTLYNYVD